MKHKLKISVSKSPVNRGIISCRSVTIRERFLRLMFGNKIRMMILVPGNSVRGISIMEVPEAEAAYDR